MYIYSNIINGKVSDVWENTKLLSMEKFQMYRYTKILPMEKFLISGGISKYYKWKSFRCIVILKYYQWKSFR